MGPAADEVAGETVEAGLRGGEAVTAPRQTNRGSVPVKGGGEGLEADPLLAIATIDGGVEAEPEVIQALRAAGDGIAETGEDVLGGEAGEALAGLEEAELAGAEDGAVELVDAFFDTVLGGGDELGGGRWGGGAEVGDEVGNGEVGLVADGGDDGEGGGGDDAGEALVVEAGEILKGATTAGDDDEIDATGMLIEPADGAGDRSGAARALHDGRVDEEVETGVAAADDVHDVADDGPGGRGDDADAVGKGGQRTLARGVEEAFGEEAGLELIEGELQSTDAAGLHSFGDELELATGFVDGEAAADEDGETVCGTEAEKAGLAAEKDDRDLGVAVFEREIDVAGGCGAAVGDFAFDPEVRIAKLDAMADVGNEGADCPAAAGGFGGRGGDVCRGRGGRAARRDGWFGWGFGITEEEFGLDGCHCRATAGGLRAGAKAG